MNILLWQGNPPFEKPSIAKGVTNFVLFKFGHLPQKDWQTMYDLAKMFLHCLNHWKLETPTARKQTMSSDDISAYKVILIDTTWFKGEWILLYSGLCPQHHLSIWYFRSITPDGFATAMFLRFATHYHIMTQQLSLVELFWSRYFR